MVKLKSNMDAVQLNLKKVSLELQLEPKSGVDSQNEYYYEIYGVQY